MTKRNGSPSDLNEDDEYRKKRQRNNLAVKKCRNLSKEIAKETKDRVEILKTENERLRGQIGELQKTVQFLEKLISEKNPRKDEDMVSYTIEGASEHRENFEGSESTSMIIAGVNVKTEIEDQDDSSIIPSDRPWEMSAAPLTYSRIASPYTRTTASNVQQLRPTFIPPPGYNIPALATSSPPGTTVISQSSSNNSFEGSESMSVRVAEVNVKSEIDDEDDSSTLHSDQLEERVAASFPYLISAAPSTSTKFIPPGSFSPRSPISPPSTISGPSQPSPKNKISSTDDDYAATLHELADSLKQLITISTMQHTRSFPTAPVDQVDSFLNFIGSFLRSLPDEELKLEVMSSITQKIFVMKKTVLQILK